MAVRLSGMVSGLDTDALVQELVSAYSTKKDKVVKAQTKLSWTQDAWKSMNTKIYSFYTGQLSALRFSKNYSKKTSTVSNSSVAKVTASSSAVNGTRELKVKCLATSGDLTGGEIFASDGSKLVSNSEGSSKLSNVKGLESFTGGTIEVKVGDTTKQINITGDTTINQFVNKLKDAGVNASYDADNNRFFISAVKSGAEGDFALTGSDENGVKALKALGIFSMSSAELKKYEADAALTDDEIQALTDKSYAEQKKTVEGQIEQLKKNIISAGKDKKTADYRYDYLNITYDETESDEITALREKFAADADSLTEEELAKLSAADQEKADKYNAAKEAMQARVSSDITDITARLESDTLTDDEKEELNIKLSAAKYAQTQLDNGVYVEADYKKLAENEKSASESAQKIIDSSQAEVTVNETLIAEDASGNSQLKDDIKSYYENLRTTANSMLNSADDTAAARIVGVDAEIELNGAKFTNNSNTFQINGLTIQVTAVTGDESVSITTDTDVDGIYDMIKDFLSSYNELIKSMDTAYNADSSRGYDPLTDDEKESMTDSEIEKWETKIKDSLLRRDNTLGSITSSMKTLMSSVYVVNGEKLSLASFGIKTLSYFTAGDNEKGVYHIDGDEDDSQVSGNTDRLRAAIASDPDKVVEFFSKLSASVYNKLTDKMASSTLSSAYTVYNDKQMTTQYNQYTKDIKEWERKISDYEEKYIKQFSAMESALSKLNSQTSSLSSLFGQ